VADNVARLFPDEANPDAEAHAVAILEATRIAEALIFASADPVEESDIAKRLPEGVKVAEALEALRGFYAGRGINLVRVNRKWLFRTSADLGWLLSREQSEPRKLSRAAIETLAICAYHQPVTRAEIEDIRGVAISKGTLDVLLETGWIRLRGRRKAPGRPVTYGTTDAFLLHFGIEQITDLPGLDELKAAGLFDGTLPKGFGVPRPRDDSGLTEDEDPLEDGAADLFDEQGAPLALPDDAQAVAEAEGDAPGDEIEE
jgi:segregation and condensation protein B